MNKRCESCVEEIVRMGGDRTTPSLSAPYDVFLPYRYCIS